MSTLELLNNNFEEFSAAAENLKETKAVFEPVHLFLDDCSIKVRTLAEVASESLQSVRQSTKELEYVQKDIIIEEKTTEIDQQSIKATQLLQHAKATEQSDFTKWIAYLSQAARSIGLLTGHVKWVEQHQLFPKDRINTFKSHCSNLLKNLLSQLDRAFITICVKYVQTAEQSPAGSGFRRNARPACPPRSRT